MRSCLLVLANQSNSIFWCKGVQSQSQKIRKASFSKTYQLNQKDKKHIHNKQITQAEHDTFTPLEMSPSGGMGQEKSKFYLWLPELINEKRESSYSTVATWTWQKIIFALIKSVGMCLRGSRHIFQWEKLEQSIKDDEPLRELSLKV